MKNIISIAIVFVITFLQITNEAYGQQDDCVPVNAQNCHTSTPNGTRVDMLCHWDFEFFSPEQIVAINRDYRDAYPGAIQFRDASCSYNCHSYAWWWASSADNHAWMNSPNDDKYWNDGSYIPANWNNGTKISYENGDHSGNLLSSYPGWVYSKWGRGPVMIHWYLDSPYTDNVVRLYKRG